MLSTGNDITQSASTKIKTLDNTLISLDATGKKKIIYAFAPWCQICHMSIGNLQNTFNKHSDVDVIALAFDYQDVKEVENFIGQHQLTIPIGLGNSQLKKSLNIEAYPSYYVIDENNKIIARSVGYSTELGLYLRSL